MYIRMLLCDFGAFQISLSYNSGTNLCLDPAIYDEIFEKWLRQCEKLTTIWFKNRHLTFNISNTFYSSVTNL